MFEQTFKNIDDILHKDAGCSSELDYVEQTSWVLFLKYLDDLEKDKKTAAELAGKPYEWIIKPEFKWDVWAAPKTKDGKIDHNKAMIGDDLKDFVDLKLFPYLKKFKLEADSPDTIQYKIGEIFSELKNKIQSGYNIREVIERVDELRFRTHAEKHEMSHLYEAKIKNMGNAGRNGGEYYTPRPLISTIVKVVMPEIGNTVYDGAVGSAGFLCESFQYMKASRDLTTTDAKVLQKRTFYGKEKKSLAYIIGIMNMILHGIEAPNIIHTNTLAENISDIQEKDRYDIIMANPPFGGKERAEVQQNFPIKTGETAFLFLQHFIKILKARGRAGVVIKNTFLSNTDNASISLRKQLLESCNLHTVLDMPGGTFTGAGVKTVVLFFEKGKPTKDIWYYHLNLDRNLGKTNPLNEADLADFVELQKTKTDSSNSWTISIADVDKSTYDLSVKNPNAPKEKLLRSPQVIINEIQYINTETLKTISYIFDPPEVDDFIIKNLGDVCEVIAGQSPESKYYNCDGNGMPFYQGKKQFGKRYIEAPTVWTTKVTKEAVEGDILMSVRAPVGPVNFSSERICIGRGLAAIRATQEINRDFLFYFLLMHEKVIVSNVGAVFNSINKNQISQIKIPLPSLEEQKRIVSVLDSIFSDVEEVKQNLIQSLDNLTEFNKVVLHKVYCK